MQKKILILTAMLLYVLCLSGCQCEHVWVNPDCTTPKTCSDCGETEGDMLGHNWESATCITPKTCSVCMATEGEPIPHSWIPANCVTPETCSVCGTTQGESSGHQEGTWSDKTTNYIYAKTTSYLRCKVCNDILDKSEEPLLTLYDDVIFLLSPDEFTDRIDNIISNADNCDLWATTGSKGTELACVFLTSDNKQVSAFMFTKGESIITTEDKYTPCFNKIIGSVKDTDYFAAVAISLVQTCDPTVSLSAAKDICQTALQKGSKTHNGITYTISNSLGTVLIGASLAN